MVRVEIPESVEGVSALADLKFETEWQLAATVVAWTHVGTHGGDRSSGRNTTCSGMNPREFASLKLRGLKSDKTIRAYRAAWEAAGGDMNINPGDAVDIPDADWSDYYGRNAIHGPNAKRAEEAAAYRQFPDGTANAATDEPKWVSNPDGSADRVVEEGVVIHKPSAAEQKERRGSPEMAGAYERADVAALSAMIGHATSYLRRAIDKAEEAGLVVPELDIVEDYLLTAKNHNSKITNTPEQSRPGLRVV